MNLGHLSVILGLVGYAVASFLYLFGFPTKDQGSKLGRAAFAAFFIATVLVTIAMAGATIYGVFKFATGLMLVASISWLTVIGYFAFQMRLMGVFVAPVSTLILLFQFFTVSPSGHMPLESPGAFMGLHILLAVLGQAFAICACAVSVLFLIQQNALKKKQLDRLRQSSTPIDKLDRALFLSLWAGFTLITLALITGAIYTQFFMGATRTTYLEWKVVWALFVWAWYLATLLARNIFGLPARRIAQLSLGGFLLLAIAFFGLLPWGGRPL